MDINNKTVSAVQKQVLLSLGCIMASFICFGLIKIGFTHWYLFLVAPILLTIVWGIYLLVADNIWINVFTSLLISLISILFFHSSILYFAWAVVILIFLIICRRDVKKELENRIKIRGYEVVRDYIKWFLILISVLIGLIYYNASVNGEIKIDNIQLPESWRIDILSFSLPEFSSSTTVNELINMLNGKDIKANVTTEQKIKTLNAIGVGNNQINGNSKVSQNQELMSLLVDKRINQAISKMGDFIPIVFGIIIWQVLSFVFYLLLPIYLIFIELTFVLLIKTGFLSINKENVQKDVIKYEIIF